MDAEIIFGWAIPYDISDKPRANWVIRQAPGGKSAVLDFGENEERMGHYIHHFLILENKNNPRLVFGKEPFYCYNRNDTFFFSSDGRYLITEIPSGHQIHIGDRTFRENMIPLHILDLHERKSAYYPLYGSPFKLFEKNPVLYELTDLSEKDKNSSLVEQPGVLALDRLRWFSDPRGSTQNERFWDSLSPQ